MPRSTRAPIRWTTSIMILGLMPDSSDKSKIIKRLVHAARNPQHSLTQHRPVRTEGGPVALEDDPLPAELYPSAAGIQAQRLDAPGEPNPFGDEPGDGRIDSVDVISQDGDRLGRFRISRQVRRRRHLVGVGCRDGVHGSSSGWSAGPYTPGTKNAPE